MRETNVTRRRILQGVGALGIAAVGTSTVIAQNETEGETPEAGAGGESAAVRVAHASPDAPDVNVFLESTGGGTGETPTPGGQEETPTPGQDGGGEEPAFEGVSFRDVTGYNEVEPGSYQVRIEASEGGGVLDEIFGGDEESMTVFEGDIEVESGTTYTVVAFGEVGQAELPVEGELGDGGAGDGALGAGTPTPSDGGLGEDTPTPSDGMGNETGNATTGGGATGVGDGTAGTGQEIEVGFGESESITVDSGDYTVEVRESMDAGVGDGATGIGGDTPTPGDGTTGVGTPTPDGGGLGDAGTGMGGGADTGFQVTVLEDEISEPGEQQSQLRVFHAVPDVDQVTISLTSEEDGGAATPTPEDGATGMDGNETGQTGETPAGQAGAGGDVKQTQITLEDNTVHSGFATGYFSPQEADGGAQDGNVTGGDNATGDGGTTGVGNQTEDGNATGTGQQEDGMAQQEEMPEFELVVVQDAQDGERANGGTNGLLNLASRPQ